MKPPKCRLCGVEEWRHVCAGVVSAASRVTQKAVERAAVKPDVKPEVKPPAADAVQSSGLTRQWRERDPEAYRKYMREYMATQRAIAAGRALRWPRAA